MKNTGVTVEEEFYKHGVMLTKSSNQRIPGWMQVHERLKVIDGVDGEKTARLKIFSSCRNLIRCISAIKADERDCNDVATEPHELTHLCDSLRYWCVMHTLSAKEPDMRTPEEKRISDYKSSRIRQTSGARIVRR
jgi:phage terminase large subunit